MNIPQKKAAQAFASKWLNSKGYEKGESNSFWFDFLTNVLNMDNATAKIQFEKQVTIDGTTKFIDAYIPKTRVLIEQKGSLINLQRKETQSDGVALTPYEQAERYASHLVGDENPLWIVVCNFRTIEIYNRRKPRTAPTIVHLAELHKKLSVFDFLTDTSVKEITIEKDISVEAGKIVGVLYDLLLAQYKQPDHFSLKSLNALCVRLVFCLYAEDAGLFGKRTAFHDYLLPFKPEQIRGALIKLFRTLDTPEKNRDKYFADDNPDLARFPYVNGGLFADEEIEIPPFTEEIKQYLLKNASADFNWRDISPTIFGAVFESTLNPETRRSGGMHYTSADNIHKVIDPLFMDSLYAEFEQIELLPNLKQRKREFMEFQQRMASLKFLDPACGSGNFLTETYISLRRLENRCLRILLDTDSSGIALSFDDVIKVNIHQFYGIEINDFAVTVAKTALWIAESQMIAETESIVQQNINFLPLHNYANIVEGNALRVDWERLEVRGGERLENGELENRELESIPGSLFYNPLTANHQSLISNTLITKYDYIMGNPPFVGARLMNENQKADMLAIFGKTWKNVGDLDYVSCWYKKAADLIQSSTTKCALVSTNSICQGGSVANLWKPLFEHNRIQIDFAHRTFRWDSESYNKAHVHCVIVGFSCNTVETWHAASLQPRGEKIIYDGDQKIFAKNINPYLIDAPNVWIESRNKPICHVPEIGIGNKPIDDGNYLFSEEEMHDFIKLQPEADKYFKPWYGSQEFINQKPRYCLWLGDCSPAELRRMPHCLKRVENVRNFRLASKSEGTRKLADKPTRFHVENMPKGNYLLIPRVSSEKRNYIPIGFMNSSELSSDAVHLIPSATLYHFGVLTSCVHMAWMRAVCGRLKSDYRYSKDIVYNNFVWPKIAEGDFLEVREIENGEKKPLTSNLYSLISKTAEHILLVRAKYLDCSLADLYDERTMPPDLRKAHQENDKAVMRAYCFLTKMTESEMVAALFEMYEVRGGENRE